MRLALLTLALAAAVPGSRFQVPGSGFQVRFHHVHYASPDPAAAMAEAARKLGGTRQIVQGHGAGVKVGDVFLIYDRESGDAVANGYAEAVAWLKAKGVGVAGEGLTDWLRANAAASRYGVIAFAASDFERTVEKLGTPVRLTEDTASFSAGGVPVEIVRETQPPDAFWCPMHPDVRSGVEGKCALCGMALVPIPPPKVGEYKLDVAVQRTARGARGVTLTVRDPETGALVRHFATVHEKIFHLFVVGRDLEYFAHVHPELGKNGAFVLEHALPPGEYMLIADFLPQGGTSQMVQRAIVVAGPRRAPAASVPDADLKVTLKVEDLAAGKDACLTFTVTDAKTGEPITDLEPLLGAPAHLLLVRADLTDAIHAHPEELDTRGPTISFHPLIPAAGEYKLWIQVQRRGRITTIPFRIRAG